MPRPLAPARSLPHFLLRSVVHAALVLAASASLASRVSDAPRPHLADVSLIERTSGQRLKVYQHQGEYWVAGRPGANYGIHIKNSTGGRILAVVSVDGVNAITGKTASATPDDGYVVAPWHSSTIAGWRKSDDQVAAFYFSQNDASYATRTGRPRDVGVIGVALFNERPPEPPRPPPVSWQRSRDDAASSVVELSAPSMPAAKNEPSAPASAVEKMAAEPTRAPRPSSPSLGTGHGTLENSRVQTVDFVSATAQPVQIVRIRYDSYAHLLAKGVIREPRPQPAHRPNPFPAPGYVPDPPRW